MAKIPKVRYGIIGGSGTWGARFPEDFKSGDTKLIDVIPSFETPYGKSAPFKLLVIAGEKILRVATHGWAKDPKGRSIPIWVSAAQVAWIFAEAGVKYALTDGSVGGIKNPQHPEKKLGPWSIVISDDFIMHWAPPIHSLYSPNKPKVRMREPFCKFLRDALFASASAEKDFTAYNRGIYICAPSYRFQTQAEIQMMSEWGANIVGETLGIEAPIMRDHGIHFASISIVSNVAEGYETWTGDSKYSMAEFYRKCAQPMGRTIMRTMKTVIEKQSGACDCDMYRLPGLEEFPVKGA